MLKYILLGFLNLKPFTGYELKSIMEQSTMHFWHAYHSQIYTTLRKMEDDGLVISDLEDDDDKLNRRRYTATEAGRAELRAWLDEALQERVQVKEDLLVRVFFSADRDPANVLEELRHQRELHQRKLDAFLGLMASGRVDHLLRAKSLAAPHDLATLAAHLPFWTATLRFGIEYEQMYLRWLDETIASLAETD